MRRVNRLARRSPAQVNGKSLQPMENLSAYADRPIAFFARYVRRHGFAHAIILASRGRRRALLRHDPIRGQAAGRRAVAGGAKRGRRLARVRRPGSADRLRQPAVAPGGLGRPLDLRRRDGRRAARSLPPSHRPRAQLFCQPLSRHADEPHHGHVQRACSRSRTCWCGTCCRRAWRRSAPSASWPPSAGGWQRPWSSSAALSSSSCSVAPPPASPCTTRSPIARPPSTAR